MIRCILALFAAQVAANQWYDSTAVIFWGKLAANKQSATVTVPIKGCLKANAAVTLEGASSCTASDQDVLIGGAIKSGTPARGLVLRVTCGDIQASPSNEDRVFYASQMDATCKPKLCVDGSAPIVCKKPQVCGTKAKWPSQCQKATKCDVNPCGGCSPVFTDDSGAQVCDGCPDLAAPSNCTGNPCDYSPKESLSCDAASTASFCMASGCGGCHAQWYDNFGRKVCASPSCTTAGANLGKGSVALGFAVVAGQCKAVKGKKASLAMFSDAAACTTGCVCVENGLVDFGKCNQPLGVTLVNGVCKAVQGCQEAKAPLKSTFFDTVAACQKACPNPPVPKKSNSAQAAPSQTSPARCPNGAPKKCDINPCLTALAPNCAEARGKNLVCVPDNCDCTAKWLLNNQPFSCPATQTCSGSGPNCCANSGLAPRDCSAFPCDIKTCTGAATCTADPCRQCMPSFKDAQGKEIPPTMCRGDSNPAAFIKCAPGDAQCCKSGFRPLTCNTPPGLLNSTCATLTCGSLAAKDRNCTVDPCDSCSLQVQNSKGVVVTDQCQMTPPTDVCTKVQCPDMGSPNCTARPPQCGDLNLMCIKDQCACKWRWYSVDMRPPPSACSAALQMCYAQTDCPNNYACDDIPANVQAQLTPAVAKQLICTQEVCSCRPVLTPPVYGLRQACKSGDANCCPDGFLKAQCPSQQAEWTCSRLACNGTTAAQCQPDGCNQCQLNVLDKDKKVIPQGKCRLKLGEEMKSACAGVQCPASSKTAACPPRPSCYPADWALECIVDPCSCRSLWVDQDVRSTIPPQCSKQIATPCITPDQCPKNFNCTDITPEVAAKLDPKVRASLVCIQEPCTCRPVSTAPNMLPRGYRLPCNDQQADKKCCADGQGPAVCPTELAAVACANVQCDGVKVSSCAADGCNSCAVKVTGPNNSPIAAGKCRLPLNESAICPGTVCPPQNAAPDCGPRPTACPSDWRLRCIRDPCVCTRSIWVDEDLRVAEQACAAAIEPPCATTCPTTFSCPGLNAPLKCVQERCTCRPMVDPASIALLQQQQQQQQQGGQQQMGQPGQQGPPPGQQQQMGQRVGPRT